MDFSEKKAKLIEIYKDRINADNSKAEQYRLENTLDNLKAIKHEVYLKDFIDKPVSDIIGAL